MGDTGSLASMVKFCDLSQSIQRILDLTEEEFDAFPERAQTRLIEMAVQRERELGATGQEDRARAMMLARRQLPQQSQQEQQRNARDPGELVDLYSMVSAVLPSQVRVERYVLRSNVDLSTQALTLDEYASLIHWLVDMRNRTSGQRVLNVTLAYIAPNNRIIHLSFRNEELAVLQIDQLIEEAIKKEQGLEYHLFEGYGGSWFEQMYRELEMSFLMFSIYIIPDYVIHVPVEERRKIRGRARAAEYKERTKRMNEQASEEAGLAVGKVVRYLVFDFETVWKQPDLRVVAYGFGYAVYTPRGRLIETGAHVADPEGTTVKQKVIAVLERFRPQDGEISYLYGFNNSYFDNYLLIEILSDMDKDFSQIIVAGHGILSFVAMGHIVRDVNRFLVTSLEEAARSFRCRPKGFLDHAEVQNQYLAGNLMSWISQRRFALKDYILNDVLTTGEILFKLSKALKEATHMSIDSCFTIGMLTYRAYVNANPRVPLPVTLGHDERIVREAMIGGRSQVFRPGYVQDCVLVDENSMYPHKMINQSFPIGPAFQTDRYVEKAFGVYRCTIYPQLGVENVIPKTQRGRAHDWEYKGFLNRALCTVDIESCQRAGIRVDIHEGVYWKGEESWSYSTYLGPILEKRKQQTQLREMDHPDYNASLEMAYKLVANSLSGKMGQRAFTRRTRIVKRLSEIKDLVEESMIVTERAGLFIVEGELKRPAPRYPTIHAVLIYAYSRADLYFNMIASSASRVMVDTDSMLYSRLEYQSQQLTSPHLFGRELGQYKEELLHRIPAGASGPHAIVAGRKCYCIYYHHQGQDYIMKLAFKGVRTGEKGDKEIEDPDRVRALSPTERARVYATDYTSYGPGPISIGTFHRLVSNQKVYLLCSQIKRQIAPSDSHRAIVLQQHFVIREFKLEH